MSANELRTVAVSSCLFVVEDSGLDIFRVVKVSCSAWFYALRVAGVSHREGYNRILVDGDAGGIGNGAVHRCSKGRHSDEGDSNCSGDVYEALHEYGWFQCSGWGWCCVGLFQDFQRRLDDLLYCHSGLFLQDGSHGLADVCRLESEDGECSDGFFRLFAVGRCNASAL